MGRGIRLQVKISSRDRQQSEELLRSGLQPVRTILRALVLRQLDLGQSTHVKARKPLTRRLGAFVRTTDLGNYC
jgi:hypothetical protein